MHLRLLFSVLLVSTLSAHSQSVKGKLVDLVDSKPLQGATVTISSLKDSTKSYNEISDSTGVFLFRDLPIDSFFVKVNYSGYAQYRQIVATNDSIPQINLGTLFIPKSVKEIEGVTVVSKVPPAQQKGDTLQLNASQFKVNPDATTEDLIKKMPGITVDRDGTVTAQGEQVRKVTIDGREFFGDDATAALRNLPSDVVDKIQVFDRLSDQAAFTGFDDGNSQKALNIVTKSGIKNGQFGRIFAGYGTDERYSAGGNVSFFKGDRRLSFVGNFNNINQQNFASQDLLGVTSSGNNRGGGNFGGGGGGRGGAGGGNFGGGGGNFGGGGNNFSVGQQSGISKTNSVGINFSDKYGKKVDMQASYFFNNSTTTNERIVRSQLPVDIKTQFTDQNSRSSTTNTNHRFNMRLEYRIDSSNSIIINPSLSFQNNESVSQSIGKTYYGLNDSLNTSDNISRSNRDGYNIRNNILYRHNFKKRGRTFSLNLNTTFNKNNGESFNNVAYRFFDSNPPTDSLQNQYRDNPTSGYNLSANFSYTEPIGKGQLQFSYNPSYQKNKADQQTFAYEPFTDKYSVFDPALSNRFDNTVTTQNGGLTYRLGPSRDNQFSVGVNFQNSRLQSDRILPTPTTVDQSFNNFLPNLMWSKRMNAKNSFRIFYRANVNFPSVTQLQDVVDISNPLRVSMGNPGLKQSYTHFVSGRYTFTNTQKGQTFFANIFLQTAQDYITSAIFSPRLGDSTIAPGTELKRGSQLTKPVNLDGYKSLSTFFTYSMPVNFIKSTINLNAGFTYNRLPGLFNQEQTVTNNFVYSGGLVVASNISEFVDFNLSYNARINNANTTTQSTGDNSYVNQAVGGQVNLLTKNGWFIQNDVIYQSNTGLAEGLNTNFVLWNAGFGKKFLKNRAGELKLSVFDLLKQNQSVTRTVTGLEIVDEQNNVLQQYFMLTFTYSLKNFGTARPSRGPQGGGGRPMMNF
ncbi:TonB-dependent receptor family protein [Terrimonas sp. NA20]|uniref:TonB-dependent receptor family protein n=1 Tax=Terrimonas ginsenosidimutans TaxID=2908004 RepID=A0ABS9KL72_9BACT|nr:TonB-dependent receptor [Terrimonas ginsenosidimutans]MCG2613066.1 TonB-dependent receptor family protein [Terrimonas ginsenosidimutans]